MILPSLVLAASIFTMILLLGKAFFSPQGKYGLKKEISKRIFTDPRSSAAPLSFSTLAKHDHLSDIKPLQEYLEKKYFSAHWAVLLKRSGSKLSLSAFLLIYISAACLVFLIAQFKLPLSVSLGLAAACLYLPFFILKMKNKDYLAKFAEYLPDASSMISSNLKAGQSVETAIETVGKNAPYPISVEFQTLSRELKLGLSLDAGLKNLYARIKNPELKIFITGITLQQELGGNLSEIMENLEKTIRERFALEREIKVLSSQGVLSMWVLTCMPFGFAAIWLFTDPGLFKEYAVSPFGTKLIIISFAIQIIAFMWMKKIVTIKA